MTTPGIRTITFSALALLVASGTLAQHASRPAGMTHEQHMAQMQKDAAIKDHGAAAMGFDQDTTTHHFRMYSDGGAIDVSAHDTSDLAGIDRVRRHLQEIAAAFRRGDFGKPQATHSEVPPGVPVMQRLTHAITYTYCQTPGGGIVGISTTDAEARAAIHEFLVYQVREHKTGDPLTPSDAQAKGARTC